MSRGEQLKDAGRPSHSCTGAWDDEDDNDDDDDGGDDDLRLIPTLFRKRALGFLWPQHSYPQQQDRWPAPHSNYSSYIGVECGPKDVQFNGGKVPRPS